VCVPSYGDNPLPLNKPFRFYHLTSPQTGLDPFPCYIYKWKAQPMPPIQPSVSPDYQTKVDDRKTATPGNENVGGPTPPSVEQAVLPATPAVVPADGDCGGLHPEIPNKSLRTKDRIFEGVSIFGRSHFDPQPEAKETTYTP